MSTPAPAVPGILSRPGAFDASEAGFFAYHGIWAPGVRLFRNLRFAAKALIISLAFMAPMLALLYWLLNTQTDDAMRMRMNATRQVVEVARGVVSSAQGEEAAGRMTREQAQQLAMRQLEKLRYDRQEYFWINDMTPRMVMHPIKPELDGHLLAALPKLELPPTPAYNVGGLHSAPRRRRRRNSGNPGDSFLRIYYALGAAL